MITAITAPQGSLYFPTVDEINQLQTISRNSPRKRMVLPIHRSQDALVQRILNCLQPGTYVRPHKHAQPFASETIVLFSGSLTFLTFHESGKLDTATTLKPGTPPFIDIEPGVWHSMIALEPDTLLLECKRGPYDAQLDKEFAPWAPEEFTPEADHYIQTLISLASSHTTG